MAAAADQDDDEDDDDDDDDAGGAGFAGLDADVDLRDDRDVDQWAQAQEASAAVAAPLTRLVQAGARNGIMAAGKLMDAVKKRGPAPKPRAPQQPFDLNPTEDQQMILDMLKRVSNDLLLPMAQEADEACAPPEDVLAHAAANSVTRP